MVFRLSPLPSRLFLSDFVKSESLSPHRLLPHFEQRRRCYNGGSREKSAAREEVAKSGLAKKRWGRGEEVTEEEEERGFFASFARFWRSRQKQSKLLPLLLALYEEKLATNFFGVVTLPSSLLLTFSSLLLSGSKALFISFSQRLQFIPSSSSSSFPPLWNPGARPTEAKAAGRVAG